MKRLLITQRELSQYGGSEITTLELSEHAIKQGFEVDILTNYFGLPISGEFDKSIRVFGPDEEVSISEYSHVWIHHSFIPIDLVKRLKEGKKSLPKIAFHHMSSYVPSEFPFLYEMEREIADKVYFNSSETKDLLIGDEPFNNAVVLGNPAPDIFIKKTGSSHNSAILKKILIVSNHPPKEIKEAATILEARGIQTYTLGVTGSPKRVTPEILDGYDAVISIGKTVQYGIVRRIPVYCYDHFGGSGYLNEDNFDRNAYYNFSGRGFSQKSAEKIAKEIQRNFKAASEFAQTLSNEKIKKFYLSEAIKDFFSHKKRDYHYQLKPIDIDRAYDLSKILSDYLRAINYYKQADQDSSRKIDNLEYVNKKLLKQYQDTVEFRVHSLFSKFRTKSTEEVDHNN